MKKRLVWIGMILLALCLAAYWIVPNWILAKPREALIEQIRAQLQTDWQSDDVSFAAEGTYLGETVLWFTIETPENTQYRAAVCRRLDNGRYRLTKIETPSVYCADIVSYLADHTDLSAKAKAEKYAKITAKTIISSGGTDSSSYGQNAFFYDAAEGVLTAAILLIAEFCPDGKRHIISVFKLIQDLLAPSKVKGKNQFQLLLAKLPDTHKAKWFAGAALNTAEQSMQSVLSTALSRLNAFLDSELEQILCFDTAIDAELFCKQKTAVFLVMPEEDNTKYFIISLILQQLYREILVVADENGGKLDNRVVFFWDEVGTIPKIESAEMMFSASRSRRVSIVPMIQSFAQLNKNYGKEGAEIIIDNCQDTIFGGFAPNSESAEVLSKSLGNKTVMSGSISRGKNDPSQSLQMIQRSLMTADELKSLPKGNFIVSKTGTHPMRTKLKLFLKWGITFEEPYEIEEKSARKVAYADKQEIEEEIIRRYMCCMEEPEDTPVEMARTGGMQQTPLTDTMKKMRQTLRTED